MRLFILALFLLLGAALVCAQPAQRSLREVNKVAQPAATSVIAIVGANLIDGRGGPVIPDSVVVVRGEQILAVGKQGEVKIPSSAEVIDAKGLTLLPGLIDAHFHIDGDDPLPALFLSHGVTSVRDPGQWIEAYDAARAAAAPVPPPPPPLPGGPPRRPPPPAAPPRQNLRARGGGGARRRRGVGGAG